MENNSLWQENERKFKINKVKNIITDSDILIIGGGITGLSTAYFLKDSKNSITIIDKDYIGNGITAKSTAKITFLQNIIYQTLENNFNKEVSKKYFEAQIEAIHFIKEIVAKEKIKCQVFFNRSDMLGGSTLGNILTGQVSIKAADIGLPQLSMHSTYETAGCKDLDDMITLLGSFYELGKEVQI